MESDVVGREKTLKKIKFEKFGPWSGINGSLRFFVYNLGGVLKRTLN